MAWGSNQNGQLGLGQSSKIEHPEPILIKALMSERITNICVGESNCVIVTQSNKVFGWGRGFSNLASDSQCEVISYLPSQLSSVETYSQYLIDPESKEGRELEPILSVSNDDDF